jgi:hypothetical protein
MSAGGKDEPYIGSGGRALIVNLAGSVALAAFYLAWLSPSEKSDLKDEQFSQRLSEDRAEIGRMREQVNELGILVRRLEISVEEGTGDRFTQSDNRMQREFLDLRAADMQRQLDELKQRDAGFVGYLTQEKRLEDARRDRVCNAQ